MTYPTKFRAHVLSIKKKEKLTFEQASHRFSIGSATLKRWSKSLEPKLYTARQGKIDLDKLRKDVEDNPDDYQYERAARFKVVQSAIHVALKKLNITYKKSPSPPKSR